VNRLGVGVTRKVVTMSAVRPADFPGDLDAWADHVRRLGNTVAGVDHANDQVILHRQTYHAEGTDDG